MANFVEIQKMRQLVEPTDKDRLKLQADMNAFYRTADEFVTLYTAKTTQSTQVSLEDWGIAMIPEPMRKLLIAECKIDPTEITLAVYAQKEPLAPENMRVGLMFLRKNIPWTRVNIDFFPRDSKNKEVFIDVDETHHNPYWT